MKHIRNILELFVEQLKEQYSGERLQLEALPKLRELTTNPALHQLIDHHIGKTRQQLKRLDHVFRLIERNLHGEENLGVKGLINEAIELAERCADDLTRDAGIITSVQHMNHHNIASYRTLKLLAEGLKLEGVKALLNQSLKEEKSIDNSLFGLAKVQLNLDEIH